MPGSMNFSSQKVERSFFVSLAKFFRFRSKPVSEESAKISCRPPDPAVAAIAVGRCPCFSVKPAEAALQLVGKSNVFHEGYRRKSSYLRKNCARNQKSLISVRQMHDAGAEICRPGHKSRGEALCTECQTEVTGLIRVGIHVIEYGHGPAVRQMSVGVQDQEPGRRGCIDPTGDLSAASGRAFDPRPAQFFRNQRGLVLRAAVGNDEVPDQALGCTGQQRLCRLGKRFGGVQSWNDD